MALRGSRGIPQAVREEPEDARSLILCTDFSFPTGRAARWQNFPTLSRMHLPACPPLVARVWSARSSRVLGILG